MKLSWMKRLAASLCAVIMIIALVTPVNAAGASQDNQKFTDFMNQEFVKAMEDDFLTMHFTVQDYAAYGITKPTPTVGTVTLQDYADNVSKYQASLDALSAFDYDSLSSSQQYDYDIYKNYLEVEKELNQYPMLDFYFSPGEGVLDNLLTNFTEYKFYSKQDIDDYLSLIASTPAYLDQALDLTRTQAGKGYFLNDDQLDETEDSIDKFVAKTDDNELIVIFEENVDAFTGISEAEKLAYKKQNREIVLNQYIPAYAKVKTELEKLRGSSTASGGIASYQDGTAYFNAKVRQKCSSTQSVNELLDLCSDYLDGVISDYISLSRKNKNLDSDYDKQTVSVTTPDTILAHLQGSLQEYPAGPTVTYTATYLDPSVANSSLVAYYMQPPIDDIKDNVIKINGDNVSDANELYGTLAHEGFPGHLYQITWFLNTSPNPLRSAISNTGYTEGWAMYTELAAYDYSSGLSSDVAALHQIYTGLGYVEDAAIDLGVNGLNWSVSDISDYLEEHNLNSSAAQSLYDFVTKNPGEILPYGLGLVQFENLRDEAENALGSNFDVLEFNTVLLTNGDRPFEIVSKDVESYLAGKHVSTSATGKPSSSTASTASSDGSGKVLLYGIIGALAVILVVVLMARKKYHEDDPFNE